jgi:branched-chain amino acid transport system substrate-binding protein
VTSPAEKPPRTIRIGATVPLTGAFAPSLAIKEAMWKNMVDMINKKFGGIYVEEYGTYLPIEIILYDDKCDIPTVQKFYEKLCTVDNVDILLGPVGAESGRVASLIAEKYGVPMIETEAQATATYARGNKWVVSPINLVYFWMHKYLEMLKAEGEIKTIVAAPYSDDDYGRDVLAGLVSKAKELGFELLHAEMSPPGIKDFTPLITKLKGLNPDVWIQTSNYYEETITFLKQAYELGFRPKEFHAAFGAYKFVQEAIPPEIGNYITADIWYSPTFPYQGVWGKSFEQEVYTRSGLSVEAYPYPPISFNAFEIAVQAIRFAGTLDKEKIRDMLWKMNTQTIFGNWFVKSFKLETEPGKVVEVAGLPTFTPVPVQVIDRKWYVIWPPELREREHILQYKMAKW